MQSHKEEFGLNDDATADEDIEAVDQGGFERTRKRALSKGKTALGTLTRMVCSPPRPAETAPLQPCNSIGQGCFCPHAFFVFVLPSLSVCHPLSEWLGPTLVVPGVRFKHLAIIASHPVSDP